MPFEDESMIEDVDTDIEGIDTNADDLDDEDDADSDDQTDAEDGAATPESADSKPAKPKSKGALLRNAYKTTKAERDALKAEKAERDTFYANLGAELGYTNIKTEADYRKALAADMAARRERAEEEAEIENAQKAFGYDRDQAAAIVAIMRRGNNQTQVQQPIQQPAQQQPAEFSPEAELAEANKAFGLNLKKFDDITTLDNWEQIKARMMEGDSLKDAILHVNFEPKKSAEATRQALLNQLRGTGQVTHKQGGGKLDPVDIPDDEVQDWAANFGVSIAEAKKQMTQQYKQGLYIPPSKRTARLR
jgi:hypothetical protein